MAEKETKSNDVEREYLIPLRIEWNKVPRYKRANKAVKAIKEFLAKHMKVYDRDLKKIKIDRYLNEEVWFRGIKKPPAKIKVKATKDSSGIVRAELAEMPDILKFKKAREEKREQKAVDSKKTKKEEHKHEEEKSAEEKAEEKKEEKEKKSAVVESTEKLEKARAKEQKHQTKQSKQPKRPVRQAMAK